MCVLCKEKYNTFIIITRNRFDIMYGYILPHHPEYHFSDNDKRTLQKLYGS